MNSHKANHAEDIQNIIRILTELHSMSKPSRAIAINRIKGLDQQKIDVILTLLQDQDEEVQCDAATALFLISPTKYQEAILPLLRDPQGNVRWHIAGLLHDFGDSRATEILGEVALKDPDVEVRYNACLALSSVGDVRALPALKQVIEHDEGADYEGRLVSEAAQDAYDKILSRQEKPDA